MSAPPAATRIALTLPGVGAIRTWLVTGPPFWASPAMSITPAPFPSRCAAMARIAPMVTTPVPPTPVISIAKPSISSGGAISGSAKSVSVERSWRFAPWTVTKLGQKPLMQEVSLLQEDWSTARLRPNSVSTGTSATQFDCTPQSPQPSQTSSLMTIRASGSG